MGDFTNILRRMGFYVVYWLASRPCNQGFSGSNHSKSSWFSNHFCFKKSFYNRPIYNIGPTSGVDTKKFN